jgi:hypothetical protein
MLNSMKYTGTGYTDSYKNLLHLLFVCKKLNYL